MAAEAAGSELEVQGQGKGPLINGQVGGDEVSLDSEEGVQGGGEEEGEGDEAFEDVRVF